MTLKDVVRRLHFIPLWHKATIGGRSGGREGKMRGGKGASGCGKGIGGGIGVFASVVLCLWDEVEKYR